MKKIVQCKKCGTSRNPRTSPRCTACMKHGKLKTVMNETLASVRKEQPSREVNDFVGGEIKDMKASAPRGGYAPKGWKIVSDLRKSGS